MSKPVFAPLLAYRERLIDILNNDEVWNDGRCSTVFDASKVWCLLEEIEDSVFTDEQKEAARAIQKKMHQIDGLFADIADLIDEVTSTDEEIEAEAA